jgi:Rad3-related DNA helicase
MYKNHLENYNPGGSGGGTLPPIMDIEEVVQEVGRRDKVCPYFYTRDSSEAADLVLLPYNYLLDSSIRSSLKLNWQHAVVIFDEAHNLEKVASDAASFTLSSAELASCIQELQTVLKGLQEYQSLDKEAAQVAGIEGALKPGKEEPTIQVNESIYETSSDVDDGDNRDDIAGDSVILFPNRFCSTCWFLRRTSCRCCCSSID